MSIQVQDLSQTVRRAQLVEKAQKSNAPLPLCLLQNINVSQEMVMSRDWCNPVLQREIQSRFLLTAESELFKAGEVGSSKNILASSVLSCKTCLQVATNLFGGMALASTMLNYIPRENQHF
jgi:hypothetical protein